MIRVCLHGAESTGKSVRRDLGATRCQTAAIVWGDEGTNAQHAFFQLLHQGTRFVPIDFIASLKPSVKMTTASPGASCTSHGS